MKNTNSDDKNSRESQQEISQPRVNDASVPVPQGDPLDVMRAVYQELEFNFDEDDGVINFRIALESLDVQVMSCGSADDLASVVVRFPIRATPEFRDKCGEFLHRLNYRSKRKFWEMDYTDGEISMAAYIDTLTGPLTGGILHALLEFLLGSAERVFPYLTSVLSGRMTPDFAADQAMAAIAAHWKNDDEQVSDEGQG